MSKFKEGDRVRILTACSGNRVGEVYRLKFSNDKDDLQAGGCTCEDYWELIEEFKRSPKFKVGDKVVKTGHNPTQSNLIPVGFTATIIELNYESPVDGRIYDYKVVYDSYPEEGICALNDEYCNLVTNEPSDSSEKKVGKIVNNIKTFVKNLALSADEKLLRKYGFKNECGEYTAEARDFAIQKACEEQEKVMVEVAKGLAAEEKNK